MSESESLAHDWFPRALPDNVVIGERSWLYSSFAFLHYRSDQPCGVRIGSDSGLYNGTFFDLGPLGEVEIGESAIVGAATVVDFEVPPGAVVAGNPARVVGHIES